jgi:hypothetical protein
VAGELALAVGQCPLDLAHRLGSAAGVLAGGDEHVEGGIEVGGVEQAGEPAVQVGEQVGSRR